LETTEEIRKIIEPVLADLGFELVDRSLRLVNTLRIVFKRGPDPVDFGLLILDEFKLGISGLFPVGQFVRPFFKLSASFVLS